MFRHMQPLRRMLTHLLNIYTDAEEVTEEHLDPLLEAARMLQVGWCRKLRSDGAAIA